MDLHTIKRCSVISFGFTNISFGTEAGLFQQLGISTVVCGPGSIEQAHKTDEYVSFDELKLCLKMLIDLKNRISN